MSRASSLSVSVSIIFSTCLFVCSLSFITAFEEEVLHDFEFVDENLVWFSKSQKISFHGTNGHAFRKLQLAMPSYVTSTHVKYTNKTISVPLNSENKLYVRVYGVENAFFNYVDLNFLENSRSFFSSKTGAFPECMISKDAFDFLLENEETDIIFVDSEPCKLIGFYNPEFNLPHLSFSFSVLYSKDNFSEQFPMTEDQEPIILARNSQEYGSHWAVNLLAALSFQKSISLSSTETLISLKEKVSQSVEIIVLTFTLVILILSAAMLGSLKMVEISDREGELGLKLAVGATKLDIAVEVLVSSLKSILTFGFTGIIVGMLITEYALKPLINGYSLLTNAVIEIDFNIIIQCITVLAFMTLLAAYLPLSKALKIDPAITMRRI